MATRGAVQDEGEHFCLYSCFKTAEDVKLGFVLLGYHGNPSSPRRDIIISVTRVGQENIPGVEHALWLTQQFCGLP